MELDWQGVSSASGWVQECAYDYEEGNLYVRFKGATCIYDVPESVYIGLLNAPSAGTFVHEYLYYLPYRTG